MDFYVDHPLLLIVNTVVALQLLGCAGLVLLGRRVSTPAWLVGPMLVAVVGNVVTLDRMAQIHTEISQATPDAHAGIAQVGLYYAHEIDVYGQLAATLAFGFVAWFTALSTLSGGHKRQWNLRGGALLTGVVLATAFGHGTLSIYRFSTPQLALAMAVFALPIAVSTLRTSHDEVTRANLDQVRFTSTLSAILAVVFSATTIYAEDTLMVSSALLKSSVWTREMLRDVWDFPHDLLPMGVIAVGLIGGTAHIATQTRLTRTLKNGLLVTAVMFTAVAGLQIAKLQSDAPLHDQRAHFLGIRPHGDFRTPEVDQVQPPTSPVVILRIDLRDIAVGDRYFRPPGKSGPLDAAESASLLDRLTYHHDDRGTNTLVAQINHSTPWSTLQPLLGLVAEAGYTQVAFVAYDAHNIGVVTHPVDWSPNAAPTDTLQTLLNR